MGDRLKRSFDVLASATGLVAGSPLMLMIALAIRIESTGPSVFRQTRVGLHGRRFEILKFRTMCHGAESMGRETLGKGDPRITAVGAWLRRFKLDELPQLVNVIRGDMSLVGPRPEIPHYADRYPAEDQVVFSIRPGITDPSSIALADLDSLMDSRGSESAADFYERVIQPQKLALQRQYVRERSFLGDLSVIARTIVRVLRR